MPQCPAIHPTRSGAVFCTKEKGHEEHGDLEHRGFRKRWTERPAVTPPLIATPLVALREHPVDNDHDWATQRVAELRAAGEAAELRVLLKNGVPVDSYVRRSDGTEERRANSGA